MGLNSHFLLRKLALQNTLYWLLPCFCIHSPLPQHLLCLSNKEIALEFLLQGLQWGDAAILKIDPCFRGSTVGRRELGPKWRKSHLKNNSVFGESVPGREDSMNKGRVVYQSRLLQAPISPILPFHANSCLTPLRIFLRNSWSKEKLWQKRLEG